MDKDIVLNNAPWELLKISLMNAALFLFVAVTLGSADLFFKTGNNTGLFIHLMLSPVYYVMISLFYFLASLLFFRFLKKIYFKNNLLMNVIMTYTITFINTLVMYFFIKWNFDFSFYPFTEKSGLLIFMLVFFMFMSTWFLLSFNNTIRLPRKLKVSEKEIHFWKETLDKKEYFG